MSGSERLERSVDWLFRGNVSPWVYTLMRVGVAAILLIRQSDWLHPWAFLEHHGWVKGLDFLWSISTPPYLVSPLVPGLVLGPTATLWLVYARTALAVLLLLGVRPRLAALMLATVSYLLFASDRYRYFHHLHLLYLSIAWLSLAPLGDRWNLERTMRRGLARIRRTPDPISVPSSSPLWPLQLIRALVLSVYLAAGLNKVNAVWLRGETLELLDRFHTLAGATWTTLHHWLGYGGVAKLVCLTELALPALLAARATRRSAIVVAALFHALISASMMVSTFGAQMLVLLLAFWPKGPGAAIPRFRN